MADLEMKDAEFFADSLCSIGHPMLPATRTATALDLVSWCKGAIINGAMWRPDQQAQGLVNEARDTFGDWAKAGGTTALRALFLAKYAPTEERKKRDPAYQEFDTRAMEAKYGKPDPGWSAQLLKTAANDHASQIHALRYQAIRDSLYYSEGPGKKEIGIDRKFWQDAIKHHNEKHPEEVAFFRAAIASGDVNAVPPMPEYDSTKPQGTRSMTPADMDRLKKRTAEFSKELRATITAPSDRPDQPKESEPSTETENREINDEREPGEDE